MMGCCSVGFVTPPPTSVCVVLRQQQFGVRIKSRERCQMSPQRRIGETERKGF